MNKIKPFAIDCTNLTEDEVKSIVEKSVKAGAMLKDKVGNYKEVMKIYPYNYCTYWGIDCENKTYTDDDLDFFGEYTVEISFKDLDKHLGLEDTTSEESSSETTIQTHLKLKLEPFCIRTEGVTEEKIQKMLDLAVECGAEPVDSTELGDILVYDYIVKFPFISLGYVGVSKLESTNFSGLVEDFNNNICTYQEAMNYLTSLKDSQEATEDVKEHQEGDCTSKQEDNSESILEACMDKIISQEIKDILVELKLIMTINLTEEKEEYILAEAETGYEYRVKDMTEFLELIEGLRIIEKYT